MSIKIGSNELTSAGSASYNGTDLNKIIFNGTTVWIKGGSFTPNDSIALYDATYSSGLITFKLASQGDPDYIQITANNPVEVELQLELIWSGRINSGTVNGNKHYVSVVAGTHWILPPITVPAGENTLQIPAVTQSVAMPSLVSGPGTSVQILSNVRVKVHNLTMDEVTSAQAWDDGVEVKW